MKNFKNPEKSFWKALDFIHLKRYTFKHQKQTKVRKGFTEMMNMKVFANEYFMYRSARFMSAYSRSKKSWNGFWTLPFCFAIYAKV